MDFLDLVQERYSCRFFSDKPIREEIINLILEAGRLAPTAGNKQSTFVLKIDKKDDLERLQNCKPQHYNETLALVVCYDKTKCYVRDYDNKSSGEIDCAICATQMMLKATEEGVGSTWIMKFDPLVLKKDFNLDENYEPVAILVLGMPSKEVTIDKRHYIRKDFSEFVKES